MPAKLIKHLLYVMIATFTFNAHAVFIAEVDTTGYEWLAVNESSATLNPAQVEEKLTDKTGLYKYEYTSRELEEDLSHTYTTWQGANEWYSGSALLDTAYVTASETSDNVNGDDSLSVRVLLLIISGLIGVFGLTKDRSHQ